MPIMSQTIKRVIKHHVIEPNQPAIAALSEACDLSRAELKQCFTKGAVWVTALGQKPMRVRRVKKPLKKGDCIELYYNPDVLNATTTAPTLILDNLQYSIWIKPRGMLSQGSKWGDHTALYRWVEMNYQAPNESQSRQAWLVHRLDRATAGLQLLAHTKKMAQTLTQLFEHRQINKYYQAIVHGRFPQEPQTYKTDIDGRPATTHAERLHHSVEQNVSLINVAIESGRKHQIRKHLSEAGFAVVGDRLYGGEEKDARLQAPRPNLQLTAYQLEFDCPLTQAPIKIELESNQLDLMTLRP